MITAVINTSLDGFCNHMDVVADDRHHEFNNELIAKADILLLGRVTFQLFEEFWPKVSRDKSLPEHMHQTAALLTEKKKIVVSGEPYHSDWNNTFFVTDLDYDTIQSISNSAKKSVLILGSPAILTQLAKMNQIGEYYFLIHPIISGKGKRLFEQNNLTAYVQLKLHDSIVFPSGVNVLHFRR